MRRVPRASALAAFWLIAAPALSQQPPATLPVAAAPAPPYADLADLVLAAPVIVDATIRSTSRLKPEEAPDAAPGTARLYIEADVLNLIRAPAPTLPRIGYLLDVRTGPDGRLPKLKKLRVLLFARATTNPAQLQLVRIDGQRDWTPAAAALTQTIVKEALAPSAPLAVTGVGHVFHTPGDLPGDGRTEIFLKTATGAPISIGITRAQGQRHWSVALSEVVGDATAPPPHDTLLWYRLACGLPRALPEPSTADTDPADADIAREDYRFVLQALGPCDRGR